MPKATWGAGDSPLSADDIDNAEVPEARVRYSGPVPPSGTYRFTLQSIKKDTSAAGNDKIVPMLVLDGDWKPNHKQYDGAPLWHHLALTKANAPQVRNFLESIGATSKDLLTATIVDENGYITKLGKVGDPAGIQVYVTTELSKPTTEYPDRKMQVAYAGYILVEDGDDDAAGGAASDGAEPPF